MSLRSSKRLPFAALAFVVCAAGAFGQTKSTPASSSGEPSRAQVESLLNGRSRATLHPGDPLELHGTAPDGVVDRSATPALAQGKTALARVDPEAARQRTLSLYGDRATFSTPLADAQEDDASPGGTGARTRAAKAGTQPMETGTSRWVLGAGFALVVGALFLLRKLRSL